ncbi:MAG: hypothetical protein KDB22_02095 [Planctomycetales bacterium]|nr:hypothetical protein [Planctomycetales bacterium]
MKRDRGRNLRWRRTTLFLLFVWLCLTINDGWLRLAARRNPGSRVNWLFQHPSTHFDLAILGSSMFKEGLDPFLLEQLTEKRTVQLAWGGRGLSEQALYLELFLARHSCSTLILELHPRGLELNVLPHPLDEFRYVAHLDQEIVRRHLRRSFGALRTQVWRIVPMWAMAEFSTQIGWHDWLALRRGVIFDPNAPADNDHTGDAAILVEQRRDPQRRPGAAEQSALSLNCFEEILLLCQQHDVHVVAVYPPVSQGSDTTEDRLSLDRYRQLLGEGVTVWASPQADFQFDPNNFQDAYHLNRSGSRVFTEQIAAAISSER